MVRRGEFAVAVVTAAAVIGLNVQYGIVVAIAASIIDHLRHSYRPRSSVLVKSAAGHWQTAPVEPGARTVPGLVVYRFGTSLYFANASRFVEDVITLTRQGGPLRWLVLDARPSGTWTTPRPRCSAGPSRSCTRRHIQFVMTSVVHAGAAAARALRDDRRPRARTASTTPRARRWRRSTPSAGAGLIRRRR